MDCNMSSAWLNVNTLVKEAVLIALFRKSHQPQQMIVYTCDQLLSYKPAVLSIPRCVRKCLFTFRLWRPHCACAATVHSPKSWQNASASTTTIRATNVTGRFHSHQLKLARSIQHKSAVLADVLSCYDLDVSALTESWHDKDDDLAVWLVRPTGYQSLDAVRSSSSVVLWKQHGGGVVLPYKDSISANRLSFSISLTIFEMMVIL